MKIALYNDDMQFVTTLDIDEDYLDHCHNTYGRYIQIPVYSTIYEGKYSDAIDEALTLNYVTIRFETFIRNNQKHRMYFVSGSEQAINMLRSMSQSFSLSSSSSIFESSIKRKKKFELNENLKRTVTLTESSKNAE